MRRSEGMRVCPKCGYVDPVIWKQSAFKQNICFTQLCNLELENPEIAKKLREKRITSDGFYAYRLTRFLRVERQAIIENPNWQKQWEIPAEQSKSISKLPRQWRNPAPTFRTKNERNKKQTKLLEVKQT